MEVCEGDAGSKEIVHGQAVGLKYLSAYKWNKKK